ncbi:MAG: glycine betaine ABC transporter substrate-binding protein [Anaerosomatales bacterium]|nr:glycine betaine ABC transporter substrate-binding protein [Anaerosomatales bacterium]
MHRYLSMVIVLLIAGVLLVGCGGDGDGPAELKGPITIGSKIDVEGPVLGYVMAAVLEDAGFEVVDRMRTGATDVVRRALLAGEIDAYPEYTANALTVFYADEQIDPAILQDAAATYEEAARLDLENENIVWLAPAPANNTWAVAVPRALAEDNAIGTLEDWAAYINDGGDVKVAGSQEFFDRDDAMPGFEAAYGFSLSAAQKVSLATGDTAVTARAAAEGTDGVNAAMVYGTDGTIAALDLFVLGDPLGVQPIYQPAPIFRAEVIDEYPEIADLLEPVFARLDLETLQALNAQVALEGQDAQGVAESWLSAEGFIE